MSDLSHKMKRALSLWARTPDAVLYRMSVAGGIYDQMARTSAALRPEWEIMRDVLNAAAAEGRRRIEELRTAAG